MAAEGQWAHRRDAREGGGGWRAWTGRSRVDETQVHPREPSEYSAREGGEWVLRGWDCSPVHRRKAPLAKDL